MVLNGISLAIDTIDVSRYLRGDRGEVVKGLDGTAIGDNTLVGGD